MVSARFSLDSRTRAVAVGGLVLTLLLAALDSTIVGTAMPRILAELGGLERYTWVTTAYLLTSTVTVPLAGKLSDIYGRRAVLIAGTTLFLITSAMCGVAGDLTQLIAFRALQGVGGGAATAAVFAAVPDLFSPTARARLVGLFTGTYGLASIIGPLLGGALTDGLGWRSIFFVNIPLGLVALAILVRTYPSAQGYNARRTVDYRGAVALVAGTGPLLFALSLGGRELGWISWPVLSLVAVGVVGLLLFLRIESRATDPIIPLAMLRSREVGIPTAGMALMAVGMFGATLFVPLFLQGVSGHAAATSGSTLAPLMLAFVVSSIGVGQVIARIGHYRLLGVGGMLAAALGLALMSTMRQGTGDLEVVRNLIVTGLGLGAALSSFAIANQNGVSIEQVGISTALGAFARAIGGTFGSAGLGAVLTSRMQGSSLTSVDGLASGLQSTFLVAMLVLFAGAVLVLFVQEVPLRAPVRARQDAELSRPPSPVEA